MDGNTREEFMKDGFIVERGVLPEADVAFYIEQLERLSAGRDRWTLPDGVNLNPAFWSIIFNERILGAVRRIYGPTVRYLPHNDLHFGFSSFSWHRDSVNREAGVGPDWDESREPYQLLRVGIYLQRFEESRFKLGLVPGSHRLESGHAAGERKLGRRMGRVASVFSGLTGMNLVGKDAHWVATEPGDCVIFDPRVIHTGSKAQGPKYSMFVGYGVESEHFRHHWHYYLHLRQDLGYSPIDPKLAQQLREADLLPTQLPAEGMRIEGAWIPSAAFTSVVKHFK